MTNAEEKMPESDLWQFLLRERFARHLVGCRAFFCQRNLDFSLGYRLAALLTPGYSPASYRQFGVDRAIKNAARLLFNFGLLGAAK